MSSSSLVSLKRPTITSYHMVENNTKKFRKYISILSAPKLKLSQNSNCCCSWKIINNRQLWPYTTQFQESLITALPSKISPYVAVPWLSLPETSNQILLSTYPSDRIQPLQISEIVYPIQNLQHAHWASTIIESPYCLNTFNHPKLLSFFDELV